MYIVENVKECVAADGTKYYEIEDKTLLLTEYGGLVELPKGMEPSKEAVEKAMNPDFIILDGPEYTLIDEGGTINVMVIND